MNTQFSVFIPTGVGVLVAGRKGVSEAEGSLPLNVSKLSSHAQRVLYLYQVSIKLKQTWYLHLCAVSELIKNVIIKTENHSDPGEHGHSSVGLARNQSAAEAS